MKLSQIVAASVAAFAVSAASAAPTILDLSSGSATFSGSLAEETFQFTLGVPATDGIGSVFTQFTNTFGYDLTSVTFGSSTLPVISINLGAGMTTEFVNLFSGPLAAGTYSFTVKGTPKMAGGSFTGNISVTPVPEAESIALALAGLGVVGAVAARRRKQ